MRRSFANAKAVGLHDAQPLQNFLTDSPWSVVSLRDRCLEMTKEMLNERSFKLVIDETGDKKKGNHTDYVARQYIGNLGKIENGIVSVNAYGVLEDLIPLMFKIYKPRKRLLEGEPYKTKPQLAVEIIESLVKLGFKFDLILADSLYGTSPTFIAVLEKYHLNYLLAIRSNNREFILSCQLVKYEQWQEFERTFSDGKSENRYIQQITFTEEKPITYWRITTDPNSLPKNQTWYVKTNLKGNIADNLGNLYGFRNWVEYAFKQGKNELGSADFRLSEYHQIEKWWEIVMSAYFLVSLQAQARNESDSNRNEFSPSKSTNPPQFSQHKWWDFDLGWKSTLNNLRLIIQPYIFWNLIKPWLVVFANPYLHLGFQKLIERMNQFHGYIRVDSG